MDLQWFDKCFDKHDFNELNNLDYNILNYVMQQFTPLKI